jgi:hypothetical protein
MSLSEFNIGTSTGSVGARIYESSSGTLLASADQTVATGFDQSLTLPVTALLLSAQTYRVSFFISAGSSGGSGDLFDADPLGLALNDYLDATGSVQVIQAFSIGSDAFPTIFNGGVPFITIEATPSSSTPEPSVWLLVSGGMASLMGIPRSRRPRHSRSRCV